MNIIYNTQENIATNIKNFLLKVDPNIRKSKLKIIPFIIFGLILSESVVSSDIAKFLKDDFSFVQLDSVIKRIKRFFSNKLFNPYSFYDKIIRFVLSSYKVKHKDKRVHIIFDHMFSHDNFTVFMFSLRIGKQGIPLWFRCFNGKSDSNAFSTSLLKEGISYVSGLFPSDFNLIFLADRWFNSIQLYEHISSLGHTFVIRIKDIYKILIFNKRSKYKIWHSISDLNAQKYKSKLFYNIELTDSKYPVNLVISKNIDIKEPWIIITNSDPKRAIKDYGYRFGGIESIFKNQKSNGFYLESSVNYSLKYFESMYSLTCFSTLFLTIFGADYTKNSAIYKNVKLTTHKRFKDGFKRVMSLFNIGLTLFHMAFNSNKYIRIPFSFTLYDV